MALIGEACSSITTTTESSLPFTKPNLQNNLSSSPYSGNGSSFLSAASVVRQQSDTTHNNRRLTRSLAVDDERPQTSASDLPVIFLNLFLIFLNYINFLSFFLIL